jgi:N-acetylmuramoyl-L-alanine amidase
MTTVQAATSSGTDAFNLSLKDRVGKSTTLPVVSCPLSVVGCQLAVGSPDGQPTTDNRQLTTDNRQPTFKIVLDAGHGGKDPGGMGKNSKEKAIALKITQLLAIGIRTNFPRVEVIMTRSDDTFIPLYERARIANDAGADLFVSIHANIMPGSSVTYGTETFVMGQHVAKHNLAVAKRENASILLEDNVEKNYGYDPNSDEGHIMMSTFQHAFLERSILFADLVENEFKNTGRKSRGVKQAGFVVLKQTTMPAVLIETGFMSNPKEEAYLLSGNGQQKLANSILKAFAVYYQRLAGGPSSSPVAATSTPATTPPAMAIVPPTTPATTRQRTVNVFNREVAVSSPPTPARRKQWTARGVSPQPITYRSPEPVAAQAPPAPTARRIRQTQPLNYGTPVSSSSYPQSAVPPNQQMTDLLSREVTNSLRSKPSVYEQARSAPLPVIAQSPVDSTPVPYQFKRAKAVPSPPTQKGIELDKIPDNKLVYAVQLIATARDLDLTTPQWQRIPYPIKKVAEGGLNKYQIRGLSTAADAKAARIKAKEAGINEAMIVVYYQKKRLPAPSVRYLLNR